MDDGRVIIDETYKIIKGIADNLEEKKGSFAESAFASLKKDVEDSLSWAKKCRNKVWLRSKEGTDMAQGCFDAANALKEKLDNAVTLSDESFALVLKLENLAKIIATKASVMT